jgi:hypothetical protein
LEWASTLRKLQPSLFQKRNVSTADPSGPGDDSVSHARGFIDSRYVRYQTERSTKMAIGSTV